MQESFLFNDTIAQNTAIDSEEIDAIIMRRKQSELGNLLMNFLSVNIYVRVIIRRAFQHRRKATYKFIARAVHNNPRSFFMRPIMHWMLLISIALWLGWKKKLREFSLMIKIELHGMMTLDFNCVTIKYDFYLVCSKI